MGRRGEGRVGWRRKERRVKEKRRGWENRGRVRVKGEVKGKRLKEVLKG